MSVPRAAAAAAAARDEPVPASGSTVRRSARGRLVAAVLRPIAAVLRNLPDRPLHRVAHAAGWLLYWLQPARRRLVLGNLERVCRYLVESGLANERAVAAARDRRALAGMARDAFGHYVRAYLEGAILPRYAAPGMAGRIAPDDPAALAAALAAPGDGPASGQAEAPAHGLSAARTGAGDRPLIIVGLHFGAMEIPALWATRRRGLALTAPMETVDDPDLQAYFVRSRAAAGVRLVPARGSGPELASVLARGEAVVIVGDRAVTGGGARVELFGAPARLPLGPAVLAHESGAPAWLISARRTGWGDYRARIERIEMPVAGTRRDRLAGFLANEARAIERAVAVAPEQWWTLLFPIWHDARVAP